jgi:hypothetical protein
MISNGILDSEDELVEQVQVFFGAFDQLPFRSVRWLILEKLKDINFLYFLYNTMIFLKASP